MSKIQVNLDELQNFALQLGKAADECDQALGHINVDLYSLLANVPGVANRQINELEKIFRNNLKKYKNRLDDSQRLIRMTVAKMNETEMLLAREAAELGRDHAGYYANLGMFNGSTGNSSGGADLTGEFTRVEDISFKRPNSSELTDDTAWYDVVGNAILGVVVGAGKALIDIFKGLWDMLVALTTDPLGFFKGIGNAVLHPVDTFNYMWGAVETAWERDVVNGNARSRGEFFSYALVSIVGLKGLDKVGKVGKLNKMGKGGAKVDGNNSLSSAAKVHTSNSLMPIPFNVFQTVKLKELVKHNVVSTFRKGSQWTKDFFKNDLVQKALKQGVVAISNAKTLSKIRNVVNPAKFNSFFKNTFNDVIKGPLFKTKVAIDQQFRKVLDDIKNIKVPTQFRVEQLKTSVGFGIPVLNIGMTSMMDVVQNIVLKKSGGTGNKSKPSGKKTDGKYLSKEEFDCLSNRLVEVDEVIDEYMEIGGDYHVYDDGLIVRKYLDMTGEKFITRYEIVDNIPNKDRTGGSKELDSYLEGTPLAAVEYIGKPSIIAEKGVTKLVRKAAKEDYLLKVPKDLQEKIVTKIRKPESELNVLIRIEYLHNKFGRFTGEELNHRINLRGAVAQEVERLNKSCLSKREIGPAVAGTLDKTTGKYYFGINNPKGKIPEIIYPEIDNRINNIPLEIKDGYKFTYGEGSHAEVYSLNQALQANPNANSSDFVTHVVRSGKKLKPAGMMMPRCPHCKYITEGFDFSSEVKRIGE